MAEAWEQPKNTVCIGLLSTGLVTIDWATSGLLVLQKPAGTTVRIWRGLPFDVARNRIVKDAREGGYKEIFFMDTDVIPPTDAIPQLQSLKLPIVSGLYWSKKGYPGMWRAAPDRQTYNPIVKWPENQVIEVDVVGAGCLLIDVRVFDVLDKLKLPWFEWQIKDPAEQGGKFSEDFAFCRYAQQAGFKIYCHTGIKCLHEQMRALDYKGGYKEEGLVL